MYIIGGGGHKSGYRGDSPKEGDLGDQPAQVTAELNFLVKYMTLGTTIRKKIGQQFDSLIKCCTFRGRDCLNET